MLSPRIARTRASAIVGIVAALAIVVVVSLLACTAWLRPDLRYAGGAGLFRDEDNRRGPWLGVGETPRLVSQPHGGGGGDDDATEALDSGGAGGVFGLVVSLFRGTYTEARWAELLACLRSNAALPSVAGVVVLVEGSETLSLVREAAAAWRSAGWPVPPDRLRLLTVPAQPTYRALLEAANRWLPARPVVLANSDILLHDASLRCLLPSLQGLASPDKAAVAAAAAADNLAGDAVLRTATPILYALTRHPSPTCLDVSGGGANPTLPRNLCTQRHRGAWVMSADTFVFRTPVPTSVLVALGHRQNVRGGENLLMYWFARAGYG